MSRGYITLKSGRKIYANCGIVGIDADGAISGGYDGSLGDYYDEKAKDVKPLPPEDMIEIADIMIARWTAFKAKHENEA